MAQRGRMGLGLGCSADMATDALLRCESMAYLVDGDLSGLTMLYFFASVTVFLLTKGVTQFMVITSGGRDADHALHP